MLESMLSPIKTEVSTERVMRAEAELLAYVQRGSCNPQKQKQLAEAVQSAMDESSGQLAKPWATRWESYPALRPTRNYDTARLRPASSRAISLKSRPSRNRI
jgi:hypothetical protein